MTARCMSVAGSDPSGGAGIQQDLKTFAAHDVWGTTAITAITVQDSRRVYGWEALAAELVRAQIDAVAGEARVDAAKSGMLGSAEVVETVARAVADHAIEAFVVDPVLVATSGDALAVDEVVGAMRELLIPRAMLVTPNEAEARALTGEDDPREAARAIRSLGARAALVTGGDGEGPSAVDVLAGLDGEVVELTGPRVPTEDTHGTGCMLSAAVVARLARGDDLEAACARAKRFVRGALEHSMRFGQGRGAANAGWTNVEPSTET